VRQRCAAAESAGGTAVDRLTGLLDAYYGMAFELFSKSEHMSELHETFSMLARGRESVSVIVQTGQVRLNTASQVPFQGVIHKSC
jgi:hypothetical protein